MRLLATTLGLVTLSTAALAPEQPSFHVAAGSRVTKTYETTLEAELVNTRISTDGEEVPGDVMGKPEISIEGFDRVVLTDAYVAVGDGRPEVLERTFVELATESVERMTSEYGDSEDERKRESELEGKTVVFTWNADDDEFALSFKDEDADRELLEDLIEDTDLRAFLPGKAVAEDDTWEVEAAAYVGLMSPGGDLKLESTEEESDPVDHGQLRENIEGKITAKYAGRRTEGEVEVDVIELRVAVRTHADDEGEHHGATRTRHIEFEHELTGELLWAVELGRAHSLALEGSAKIDMLVRITYEGDEGSSEFEQELEFAGTQHTTVSFAKAE